jgi:hypothetical protein
VAVHAQGVDAGIPQRARNPGRAFCCSAETVSSSKPNSTLSGMTSSQPLPVSMNPWFLSTAICAVSAWAGLAQPDSASAPRPASVVSRKARRGLLGALMVGP